MPPHHHHLHHPPGGAPPPPPSPPPPKSNPKFLSLILKAIIMTLITSFFFLLLGLASCILLPILFILSNSSLHRHRTQFPSLSNGFCPKDLKRLPQFRHAKEIIKTEGENDCVVCLEGFKGGQWCRRLVNCGHVFHKKCVDTWLLKVAACPICRTRVRLDVGNALGFKKDMRLWTFNGIRNDIRVW